MKGEDIMPHAGGGGSGGGFHSSGRGSSNFKSSVPKTDKRENHCYSNN